MQLVVMLAGFTSLLLTLAVFLALVMTCLAIRSR
jgi:hypothetical protein